MEEIRQKFFFRILFRSFFFFLCFLSLSAFSWNNFCLSQTDLLLLSGSHGKSPTSARKKEIKRLRKKLQAMEGSHGSLERAREKVRKITDELANTLSGKAGMDGDEAAEKIVLYMEGKERNWEFDNCPLPTQMARPSPSPSRPTVRPAQTSPTATRGGGAAVPRPSPVPSGTASSTSSFGSGQVTSTQTQKGGSGSGRDQTSSKGGDDSSKNHSKPISSNTADSVSVGGKKSKANQKNQGSQGDSDSNDPLITIFEDITSDSSEKAVRDNDKAARDKAARDRAARDRAARDKAARDKAVREKAVRDKAAKDKAARDKAVREKTVRDKAARDRAARDKAVRDKAVREKAVRDKAARDRAARDKAARDKAVREKAVRDKAARDKAAREQAAKEPNPVPPKQQPGPPAKDSKSKVSGDSVRKPKPDEKKQGEGDIQKKKEKEELKEQEQEILDPTKWRLMPYDSHNNRKAPSIFHLFFPQAQAAEICAPWQNPPLSRRFFKSNGRVRAKAFCKAYAHEPRECRDQLEALRKALDRVQKADNNIRKLEARLSALEREQEDEEFDRMFSDEEETEARGLCVECLSDLRGAFAPSGWQRFGSGLSVALGLGLSVMGVREARRSQSGVNQLLALQGMPAENYGANSLLGAWMGVPWIAQGFGGLSQNIAPEYVCSPRFYNNPYVYNPYRY